MKRYLLAVLLMWSSLALAIRPQEQDNWCWAACIQACMEQADRPVSQPAIVGRLTGWVANRPATSAEVAAILQSYGFRAWQAGRPGTVQELYGSLAGGWKLIAFVRPTNGPVGHFIVVEGIEPVYGGIIVSDPWTGVTQPIMPAVLYQMWRWGDSVVVGKPAF